MVPYPVIYIGIYILQVVTFKPDGTNDALHFYINGAEMTITVTVNGPASRDKGAFVTLFTLVFFINVTQYKVSNVANFVFAVP